MSLIARLFGSSRGPAAGRRQIAEPPVVRGESSGTANPQPWMFNLGFAPGGQSRVKALPRVTPVAAQRHATVFACCNIIAGDLSKATLKLYQRDKSGREVRVRNHPAAYLLNVESSPGVPASVLRFALAYSFALRGKAFAFGPRDGAGDLELIEALHTDMVSVLRSGRARFYDIEDGAGVQRRVASRSVVHLRYMAEDGWTGRSPLEVAAESVGLALAGQEAAARTATGSTSRGVVKINDVYTDDETWERVARRVRNAINDPETNGWSVISTDESIETLDLSAADQQLLESRKFDREMIAAIYRMPPSKLQMLEFGVKANGEQQAIDYKTDCLLHWGGLVQDQISMSVLTAAERRAGMFFRHDFDTMLQATARERYEALTKATGGPILTPNEARKIDGRDPVEGGDKLNPAPNMTRKEGTTK